jgi:hypothetical protein
MTTTKPSVCDYEPAQERQRHETALARSRWANRALAGKAGTAILLAFLALPSFAARPCKVNVNTSSPAQLHLFARTGPILAARLASGRPYSALEAVDAVKGVGPSWLAVNGRTWPFPAPRPASRRSRPLPRWRRSSPSSR